VGASSGRLPFPGFPDAYLWVHEVIVMISESRGHRERYAYFLILPSGQLWGYERDPTHNPAVHRHDATHAMFPADVVSFKHVCHLAWETLAAM
jgi:hypothetical protein